MGCGLRLFALALKQIITGLRCIRSCAKNLILTLLDGLNPTGDIGALSEWSATRTELRLIPQPPGLFDLGLVSRRWPFPGAEGTPVAAGSRRWQVRTGGSGRPAHAVHELHARLKIRANRETRAAAWFWRSGAQWISQNRAANARATGRRTPYRFANAAAAMRFALRIMRLTRTSYARGFGACEKLPSSAFQN